MPAWFAAPAIVSLMGEVNRRWPNRSKASDGIIGDLAHSERKSDHNPDPVTGEVRAADITASGINTGELIEVLLSDPRTWYVIFESRIRYGDYVTGQVKGWQPYTGSNPHNKHIHVSIRKVGNYSSSDADWFDEEEEEDFMASITVMDQGKRISGKEAVARILRLQREQEERELRMEKKLDAALKLLKGDK